MVKGRFWPPSTLKPSEPAASRYRLTLRGTDATDDPELLGLSLSLASVQPQACSNENK